MSVLSHAAARWLSANYDEMVSWRRHLHAHPELGRQEFATTEFVARHLAEAGLNPKVLPGGTGLTCDFGPEDGPRIALRADMDALPMADRTGASYASTVPNVAHACGHDAHTAVLLGTAMALASVPELPVGVRLLFQAAEELMPGGAIDAINAGVLTGVSRIFALHCDPRLAVGRVATKPGPITSAADSIEITLHSPGGHTSRPHLTGDLVYGLGTLITGLPGVLSRRIDPRHDTVMVWGAVNAGVAANAIPQIGTLAGTIRTASRDTWLTLESIVEEAVTALLAPLNITHSLNYRRGRAPGGQRRGVHPHPHPRHRERSAPTCWPTPISRAAVRTSPGTSKTCPVPWADSGCGAGRVRSWICTSPRSTSTSVRSASACARWSTSSPHLPSYGPMLRAGRVRRSCTYSSGAPAISAASAITPR